MKHVLLIMIVAGLLLNGCATNEVKTVNRNASKEAVSLLKFLHKIQGKYILSGQHNFIGTGSKYTNAIKDLTGKHPLIWGSDFSFCYKGAEPENFQHCGPLNLSDPGDPVSYTDLTAAKARAMLVQNVIEKHKQGFIITLMWHACPPGIGGDCCDGRDLWTWDERPSEEDWEELTTDGTTLNNTWKQQADTIAFYLKQLRDEGVPILWRPYHEMNGVWFWWCNKKGEHGFRKLWIMMYDYFVNHHELNNLLWVWNTNAPRNKPGDEAYAYEEFWPGHDFVDILAADVYHNDWKQSHHDDLLQLANGKPIALGEVGNIPTPEILSDQPHWTWYMPWGNFALMGDGPDKLKRLYAEQRLLAKEDVTIDSTGEYIIVQ